MMEYKYLYLLFLILWHSPCQEACTANSVQTLQKDWWETAQFYQIYPRSFKDSNGDGVGDLNGITSKLEYLKDLGITAVWLSPIFKSPMADFGYDISDFFDIQPEFGDMNDFRNLINKAGSLGLKILLDFVPNHSSNENIWFTNSAKRVRGYEDYYVWSNGKINSEGQRVPPNNWLQMFRGSAWEWNEERQQYYFHQFAVQQPDLNYRNPHVVEQMKRVLRFWLDQGVSGFRIDAVPQLFEVEPDANGNYEDAPVSGLTDDKDDRTYLINDMLENRPETIDMSYQWRKVMDDYKRIHGGDSRVLLIETYAPPDYTMQFYGNATTEGPQLPFNFRLITELKEGVTASKVYEAIDGWMRNMPAGRTPNWVTGNHDQRRAASRYGVQNIDAMNMLVMLLPGASVTYQGEELGMTDGEISWDDTVDPAACNSNPDIYEKFTRDPSRTPFQWSPTKNAGFSTGDKTWLPLAEDYMTVNVDSETAATRSHLKIYKSLVELRRTKKTLQNGNWKYKNLNENIFALKRYLSGSETYVYVANFGEGSYSVDLSTFDNTLPSMMTLTLSSLDSTKSEGQTLNTRQMSLSAGEALILTST